MIRHLLKTDGNFVPLVLRLTLGCVIFAHGVQKVLGLFGGQGAEKTLDLFSSMGFPLPVALFVMAAEFVGGMALVLGLFTRVAALAIAVDIGVCGYINHLQHGFFMNWFGQQKGEGVEYHLLVIGISLALIISGGGLLSIDRTISRKKTKSRY